MIGIKITSVSDIHVALLKTPETWSLAGVFTFQRYAKRKKPFEANPFSLLACLSLCNKGIYMTNKIVSIQEKTDERQLDLFPEMEKKSPRSELEVLQSKVRLHFHEIYLIKEGLNRLHEDLKAMGELVGELYMRKTP